MKYNNISDKSGKERIRMETEFRESRFPCLALLVSRVRMYVHQFRPQEKFQYRRFVSIVDVHAGRSAIYDHRRALKASRLSLLNASRSVAPWEDVSLPFLYPLSLFTFHVPSFVPVVRTCIARIHT